MSKKKPENTPLSVAVKDGKLTVSIGINRLASAFQQSDYARPYDEVLGNWAAKFGIIDAELFASDVARELVREEEDGTTPVHLLLDKVCAEAVEQGSAGVEEL